MDPVNVAYSIYFGDDLSLPYCVQVYLRGRDGLLAPHGKPTACVSLPQARLRVPAGLNRGPLDGISPTFPIEIWS
jgi:hypothetical protein